MPLIEPLSAGTNRKLDIMAKRPLRAGSSPTPPPATIIASREFQDFLEATSDALIIVDPAGAIVLVNQQIEELFGYAHADVVGQPIAVLLPERVPHQPVATREQESAASATPPSDAVFGRHRDGHEFPVEMRRTPWHTQAGSLSITAIRQTSERRRVQAQVSAQEQRSHALFDHAEQFTALLAHDGTVVNVNTHALHLGQRAAPEMIGRPVWETPWWTVTPAITEQMHAAVRHAQHGSVARIVLAYPRTAQPPLTFDVIFTPLHDATGQVSLIVMESHDVSALRQAEQQMLQQANELETLMESLADGVIVLDQDGALRLANQASYTVLGRPVSPHLWTASPEERTVVLPLDTEQGEQVAPTHSPLSRILHGETIPSTTTEVYQLRSPTGQDIWLSFSGTPLVDAQGIVTGAVIVYRDITQRRQLEQAVVQRAHEVAQHQALFRLMIDALPSGAYLVQGTDARLVLANQAAAAIWGASWTPGEAMETFLATTGVRIEGFDGHDLAQDDWATLRATRGGESVQQQQEVIRHPDGTSKPILVNAVALSAAAMCTVGAADEPGALVVLQDVTPLKETERMKDEFLGIAAHELRTPLAALKGFTDMLIVQTARGRGAPLVAWQTEALTDIEQATQRLVRLVDGLLDVTRVQGGQLVLSLETHDLVAVARRVLQEQQALTDRHHLALHVVVDSILLTFDMMRIEQVLVNLLQNAVKYSPSGGTVSTTITLLTEDREVLVQICDDGIGIPADQQSRLFTRFGRTENSAGIQGTGLGLYLCRELIERHSGHIWMESTEGQGATVSFSLPTAVD